ncbi:MAG TPA: transketolase C-terminal domain-containing protein, partial [Thermoplasmata archaeon]|nr:transketolase C-terminal domain-containing protein [Thermoplasmata archaeon]
GAPPVGTADDLGVFDDLALMRTLPGMTVIEPADAPTARSTARALAGMEGPAYVRLAGGAQPTVTNGEIEIGRATELRPGTDLTLIAVGRLVARALAVANALGNVGVRARVLDLGCLKPFDEKSVLRAARETGALLTLEDQYISTGVGALVSAATAENCPVPVRRLGILDLDGGPAGGGVGPERPELSEERALHEAWELLRLKGKVQ